MRRVERGFSPASACKDSWFSAPSSRGELGAEKRMIMSPDAALKRRSARAKSYGITAATLGGAVVVVSGVEFGLGGELGDELGGTVAFFLAGDGGKLNSTPRSSLAFTVAGMSRSASAIFFRA